MAVVIFQQKLEHDSDAYKSVRNAVSFGYLERHYRAVPTINPCWALLDGFRKENSQRSAYLHKEELLLR